MAHWIDIVYEQYSEFNPCEEARVWMEANCTSKEDFWELTDRGDWMMWYVITVIGADETSLDLNREYDEYINKPEADKTEDDLEKLKELADILRNNINL